MTTAEWLTIAAIFLGPIVAVQLQKWIEAGKEKRSQRMWCFTSLMATRAARVSPRHIEALNMIDLWFSDKDILTNWKVYRDHLNSGPSSQQQDPAVYQAQLETWVQKGNDLLVDLLFSMSQALGFDFDPVQLKRGQYAPIAQALLESDLEQIRRSLAQVLVTMKDAIPVRVINGDATPASDARQAQAPKGRK